MKKTNFDLYLDKQLKDPDFAERFKRAGEARDVAIAPRGAPRKGGLSQKQLALSKLKTSQQNVSRLESPSSYQGHSSADVRRVAGILGATVRVVIEPRKNSSGTVVAETEGPYPSAPAGIKKILT